MMHMAYPWVFLALPLPWLLRWLLPKVASQAQAALNIPFYQQMQEAMQGLHLGVAHGRQQLKLTLFIIIWCLTVLAGSGLQWLGKPVQLPQSGRDIMLAIDLSGSMQTPDMKIDGKYLSRITVVKKVARQFIAKRDGDRLGLILFGSRAYLQTPLTFDRKTVEQMLADASVGIAGSQTAIGDGIGLAIKRLMKYPKDSRALVLMTDGGNNAGVVLPLDAAKKAAELGIKIYTIGLGAKRMVVNSFLGPQVVNPSSDLDVGSLKKIAKLTGGQFFRAESGNALQAIYQELNRLEPVQADKVTLRPVMPLYPYPLGLALFLLLLNGLLRQPGWGRQR